MLTDGRFPQQLHAEYIHVRRLYTIFNGYGLVNFTLHEIRRDTPVRKHTLERRRSEFLLRQKSLFPSKPREWEYYLDRSLFPARWSTRSPIWPANRVTSGGRAEYWKRVAGFRRRRQFRKFEIAMKLRASPGIRGGCRELENSRGESNPVFVKRS